jgi:plasmid stabilization system protein ParE
MRVIIRESAEADLDHIAEWIAKDSPSTAARMVATIRDRISFLETDELAHMGRPGLVEGTRELLEYPYIIVYQVHEDRGEIAVLSIVHGAQNREDE